MAEEVKEEVKEEETPKEEKQAAPAAGGTGLQPNVAALLAYLFDFLGGLIFFLIEKDNKFVRFAAIQSMVLSVVYWAIILVVLPMLTAITIGFGFFLYPIFWIGYVAIRIVLMVKAYNNEEWEVPLVGQLARNVVK